MSRGLKGYRAVIFSPSIRKSTFLKRRATLIYLTCNKCRNEYEYGTYCSCHHKSRKQDNAIKGKDDNFYSSRAWRKLREQKLNEYYAHCQRCFVNHGIFVTSNLEGHHIVSRKIDESLELEPENVVIVCKTCNLQLGQSGVDWDRSKEFKRNKINYSL